jgi:hypothetical protein
VFVVVDEEAQKIVCDTLNKAKLGVSVFPNKRRLGQSDYEVPNFPTLSKGYVWEVVLDTIEQNVVENAIMALPKEVPEVKPVMPGRAGLRLQ